MEFRAKTEKFCGMHRFHRRGMVLVMALWILSILAAFALMVGLGIRQKLFFVSRIERREEVHYVARAAVQLARSVVLNAPKSDGAGGPERLKAFMHNNPLVFRGISVGNGAADIYYQNYDHGAGHPVIFYGLEDETGKININYASVDELRRIFILTAGLVYETAQDIANAIVDWRTQGSSWPSGFYGDSYYSNLKFPYESKKSAFELLEELFLVKGMDPDIFERAKDFLTVYGDGRVNINTASRSVLLALGLEPEIVETLIYVRNGPDLIPGTEDDYVFHGRGRRLRGLQLGGALSLMPDEGAQVQELADQQKLAVGSALFRIKVKAVLLDGQETRLIDCVIEAGDGKIVMWREF